MKYVNRCKNRKLSNSKFKNVNEVRARRNNKSLVSTAAWLLWQIIEAGNICEAELQVLSRGWKMKGRKSSSQKAGEDAAYIRKEHTQRSFLSSNRTYIAPIYFVSSVTVWGLVAQI